jgi:D-alanyl-D-alanine carboxypeptidase
MVRDRFEYREREDSGRPGRRKNRSMIPLLMIVAVVFCFGGAILAFVIFGTDEETTAAVTGETASPSESGTSSDTEDTVMVDADPLSGYGQLVNRTYPIDNAATYEPDDLVEVNYAYNGNTQMMREEAAAAMEDMIAAFKAAYPDLSIYTKSGYRTYDLQNTYYTNQIGVYGSEYEAATISAIPGTSEHELGLAMDLTIDGSLTSSFEETTQGQWFLEHSNEYGYIHRYPKGSELITGIIYEPWHFRYVGKEIAADMAAKNVSTLEEYYGLYLNDEDIDNYVPYLQ